MNQGNSPKISVVMPVYNAERYLDEAIQSILEQTCGDFEFIIINDGSTDKSLEVIEKYNKQDERIILISRGNKGLIASLNEGIDTSQGKYIARMDADDVSLPKRFEQQLKLMEQDSVDICGCHVLVIDEESKYISAKVLSTSSLLNKFILCRTVPFAHGSVMIKKDFMIENKLSYGKTQYHKAEDYALWIEFDKKGAKISNVDEFLFKYRHLENSLSKQTINSKHTYSLSKMYCKENMGTLINTIDLSLGSFSKLNDIEKESISYLLIKSLFSGIFKIKLLQRLPIMINVINLLKILVGK